MATNNYLTMSDEDIALTAMQYRNELSSPHLEAAQIVEAVSGGSAVIHRVEHDFYIAEPKKAGNAHIWLLFVDPDHRGRRVGRQLVKDAITRYGTSDYPITLTCQASLRAWYGRQGFYVTPQEEKEPGMRSMVGPFKRGEFAAWRL